METTNNIKNLTEADKSQLEYLPLTPEEKEAYINRLSSDAIGKDKFFFSVLTQSNSMDSFVFLSNKDRVYMAYINKGYSMPIDEADSLVESL